MDVSYWFSQYSEYFAGTMFWAALGIISGLVVLGAAIRLASRFIKDPSSRKACRRLSTMSITVGLLSAVSFFFTQTSTPVLGSRFWFLLWVLVAVVWLAFIVRYMLKVAPQERAERAKLQAYQKYLPGSGR